MPTPPTPGFSRRDFLRSSAVAAAAGLLPTAWTRTACGQATQASQPAKPNILVILADDMGFSDLGCYGSEIATPHLDRLAAGGLRLTQFYNTARCCPSRAALLTGLYSHQAGVGTMTTNLNQPAFQGYLNDRCVTIPEVLRGQGYRTLMCGKWHVGGDYDRSKPETWKVAGEPGHPIPRQRGFDRYYGTLSGSGNYFDPTTLMRDDQIISGAGPDYYYTDALAENACSFLADASREAHPFFMYLAFTAPHFPLHCRKAELKKYKGMYKDGPKAVSDRRYQRQLALGLIDPQWPRVEDPAFAKQEPHTKLIRTEDGERAPESFEELMEVYAAMVDRLDQGVGRVVQQLEKNGQLDNTLVLFLSDNGGCAEAASYSPAWATVSNTPLRKWKWKTYEGGISTPLIAHWPKVITQGGQLNREPGHIIDLLPTCLEAGGAAYPESFGGHPITPVEGKSLLPLFKTGKRAGHQRIFWEHFGNAAVREGNWKLVHDHNTPWELYDLSADRLETQNLAEKQPDRAKQLAETWTAWAARVGATPNPALQPAKKG